MRYRSENTAAMPMFDELHYLLDQEFDTLDNVRGQMDAQQEDEDYMD